MLKAPQFLNMNLPNDVWSEPGTVFNGVQLFPDVRFGLFSYMNQGMVRSKVRLGRYGSIGRRVTLGAPQHPADWLTTHPIAFDPAYRPDNIAFHDKPTIIGHDVWIGDGAILNGGVTIGHGAIIGAGAVVTKDIPPYAIALGVPATIKRSRFSETMIGELLQLQWWNYHPQHLAKLPFSQIEECVALMKDNIGSWEVFPEHYTQIS